MENNHIKLVPREIKEAAWSETYFLTEEQQSQYEEAIKKYSGKTRKSLNVPKEGSNLFKVLLLNQEGIRTATLSELEQAINNGTNLKGFYEDVSSVVLRSNGDSYELNDYLAKLLFKEVKKRNRKGKTLKHSLVLSGLKLEEDSNSAYGLISVPRENFKYFEAPELDHENHGRRFSRLDERGMPIFDDSGNRINHTRKNGLCRLSWYNALGLGSYDFHLEDSYALGSYALSRVVVVSPEGPKNLLKDIIISN